jgi:DNA (cytosine-5)-methyltransferase 1
MRFNFIDLFSGIGGFRMALDSLGGRCIGFSEINKDAIFTYCDNFAEGDSSNFGDITLIKKLPNADLLTAGVPCQSWSIAGKNLGFDDDRGQLWNDTIFLLNNSKPKAFIFENVKGLVDPRNREALSYILQRIAAAGYYAQHLVLNSQDYGVQQNRVRIYIVGFRSKVFMERFKVPPAQASNKALGEILDDAEPSVANASNLLDTDLFGETIQRRRFSLSSSNGLNDYFLFNDIRGGHSTIHSWDIEKTTERQKWICTLLLKNRRKKAYGKLDGNPLSYEHLRDLDSSIKPAEIKELVKIGILGKEDYAFKIIARDFTKLDPSEVLLFSEIEGELFSVDELKANKVFKRRSVSISETLTSLRIKGLIECVEERYDFKNTKISTGLYGINRIFLPTSRIFPTLVASGTNDHITNVQIQAVEEKAFKNEFIRRVFIPKNFRRISKREACAIQGFPCDFRLPESRARWMKLLGNSVSVPVVRLLAGAVIDTGVFG